MPLAPVRDLPRRLLYVLPAIAVLAASILAFVWSLTHRSPPFRVIAIGGVLLAVLLVRRTQMRLLRDERARTEAVQVEEPIIDP